MTFISDLPLQMAVTFIVHALEKEREQITWDLWSGLYPLMEAGFVPFRSFTDFQKESFDSKPKYTDKNLNEIEEEMKNIITAHEGR